MDNLNPRYAYYARSRGFNGDPDGCIAEDRERFPGGHMTGFMSYIRDSLKSFCAQSPQSFYVSPGTPPQLVDQDAFTAFLDRQSQADAFLNKFFHES